LFQYFRQVFEDLRGAEYQLSVTESKHYWVKKDDYEVVKDLAKAYLEGEKHSFEFEPLNDSNG
jgi:hypothetical protein